MSRFTISELPLAGLSLITRQRMGDSRGFLSRLFCAEELAAGGWEDCVSQINHTHTVKRGTVRGLHFQRPPHAEMKLVNCLRGEVWDVVVDVRSESPTFLHWHAEILSADNCRALLIPKGFAHGFQALTDNVELLYCHTVAYEPSSEDALNPQDARLGIAWPLEITEISARDAAHSMISNGFEGVQS